MPKNYIQVELGGKMRGLKFNLGTLKHIGEITGEDPFAFSVNIKEYAQFMKDLGIIIYAGLLSNAQSKKIEPDFNFEEANRWALELENIQDALTIVSGYHSAFQVTPISREGDKDTQPEAAEVD